ncbi:hypothetical protein [Kamptonema formosum]|uniref:hypothetical protein n=1 Tax=Kamptonema formosum TaxID=331992 RepID=UPI00034907BC|nr:hypothetical protein [Oscillatoria sp. PCC 10802]
MEFAGGAYWHSRSKDCRKALARKAGKPLAEASWRKAAGVFSPQAGAAAQCVCSGVGSRGRRLSSPLSLPQLRKARDR